MRRPHARCLVLKLLQMPCFRAASQSQEPDHWPSLSGLEDVLFVSPFRQSERPPPERKLRPPCPPVLLSLQHWLHWRSIPPLQFWHSQLRSRAQSLAHGWSWHLQTPSPRSGQPPRVHKQQPPRVRDLLVDRNQISWQVGPSPRSPSPLHAHTMQQPPWLHLCLLQPEPSEPDPAQIYGHSVQPQVAQRSPSQANSARRQQQLA
mmetsp:Transcript_48503/g.113204  ORF Transcript_48503/g.113204 Transcript_48503/m.113204 type:complete len:204 (-) Transcript_48503:23-634(-)